MELIAYVALLILAVLFLAFLIWRSIDNENKWNKMITERNEEYNEMKKNSTIPVPPQDRIERY